MKLLLDQIYFMMKCQMPLAHTFWNLSIFNNTGERARGENIEIVSLAFNLKTHGINFAIEI